MSNESSFEQIVAFTDKSGNPVNLVSMADYECWKQDFTWDALHGIRYSQSFCNRFGITDYILYYKTGIDEADEYIRKNYIDNSS